MKKEYAQPDIVVVTACKEDIMDGSDTFVDVKKLWSEEENQM